MSEQLSFGFARLARDAALERVEEATDEEWRMMALAAVKRTCLTLDEFIVDDVWRIADLPRTREDRALGPVMRAAARSQWCSKTDRMRPSIRSHLSGKPVWRSLLR